MFEVLQKAPFSAVTVDLQRDKEGGKKQSLHQAGYDSYVTGYCFVLMCEYLRKLYQCKDADGEVEVSVIGTEMRRFENKLQLTYTFDLSHYNLGGKEVACERNHVFYLQFPNDWTTRDIIQLFSAFGYVSVGWLSDVSALVGLKDSTKWKDAKKCFQKAPPSLKYHISTYQEYLKKVKGISEDVQAKRKKPQEECEEVSADKAETKAVSKKNKTDSVEEERVDEGGDGGKESKESKESSKESKEMLFAETTDW